ncbi:MAG: hypothetical protein R2712_04300 [Vicinamibacterales bacterium]
MSFEAHYYRRAGADGTETVDAAAKHEGAIGRPPSYTAAYIGLADARMEARPPEALDAVDRGLAASPGDPRLLEKKGDIARMQSGWPTRWPPTKAWCAVRRATH